MKSRLHFLKLGLILLVATLSFNACSRNRTVEAARGDQQPAATPAEQDFMMKAAQANLSEIDMARLALQKSQNPDVKDFANMIQSDHTNALEDLADLMRDRGMSPPNALTSEIKMDIEKM